MGATFSPERTVMCCGLDGSGKSTLLLHLINQAGRRAGADGAEDPADHALREGEYVGPTAVVSLVKAHTMRIRWSVFDLSGQGRYRSLWTSFRDQSQGIIFVLDMCDIERLSIAQKAFRQLVTNLPSAGARTKGGAARASHDMPVLVFLNKSDLIAADGPSLPVRKDNFASMFVPPEFHNPIRVFECSAFTGSGVREGLQWLGDILRRQ